MAQIRARRATLASVAAMSGGQAAVVVLGMAGALIQARYVTKGVLGQFSEFGILAGYLTFLHMGSLTSLQREYPYWLGKDNPERARHAASVTQGWILLVCLGVAVLYAVLAGLSLWNRDFMAAAAWASQLVIASAGFYSLYLGCTYRSSSEFVLWSKITVFAAAVSFVLLPFVAWWGFWGLCIRAAVPVIPVIVLLHRCRPVKVKPSFAFRELWQQVKFGLPMDLSGFFATSCMLSTMSWLVAGGYGVEMLGLYAFARSGESVMTQFGVVVTQVFVPRVSHQMGLTDDFRHCARYVVKPTLACSAVMAVAALAATLCCPVLVRTLTPNFVDAIPILQVLFWAGLYPTLLLPKHVFVAEKRNLPVAVGFLACFASFIIVGSLATWLHWNPIVIAIAFLVGKAVNIVICYVWLWHSVRQKSAEAAAAVLNMPSLDVAR